jgi:hypothetical protein
LNSKTHTIGFQVILRFSISQHFRDHGLLSNFKDYLNCGRIHETSNHVTFVVTKLSDIDLYIIPLFHKYPLKGEKRFNFIDFCQVLELIKNKSHLTAEGLEQIKNIKAGMNKGRKLPSTTPCEIITKN